MTLVFFLMETVVFQGLKGTLAKLNEELPRSSGR